MHDYQRLSTTINYSEKHSGWLSVALHQSQPGSEKLNANAQICDPVSLKLVLVFCFYTKDIWVWNQKINVRLPYPWTLHPFYLHLFYLHLMTLPWTWNNHPLVQISKLWTLIHVRTTLPWSTAQPWHVTQNSSDWRQVSQVNTHTLPGHFLALSISLNWNSSWNFFYYFCLC